MPQDDVTGSDNDNAEASRPTPLWLLVPIWTLPVWWLFLSVILQFWISLQGPQLGWNVFSPDLLVLRSSSVFTVPVLFFGAMCFSFQWFRKQSFQIGCIWIILFAISGLSSGALYTGMTNLCRRSVNDNVSGSFTAKHVRGSYYPDMCDANLNNRASNILRTFGEPIEFEEFDPKFVSRLLILEPDGSARCFRLDRQGKQFAKLHMFEMLPSKSGLKLQSKQSQKNDIAITPESVNRCLELLSSAVPSSIPYIPNNIREKQFLLEYQLDSRYYFITSTSTELLEKLQQFFESQAETEI